MNDTLHHGLWHRRLSGKKLGAGQTGSTQSFTSAERDEPIRIIKGNDLVDDMRRSRYMSNGEETPDGETSPDDADSDGEVESPDGEASEAGITLSVDELEAQLDDIGETIEAANTEADLDHAQSTLETVETGVETLAAADASDSEDADDEDDESPVESLQTVVEETRETLSEARGPYDTDVIEQIETVSETIDDTRWTANGISSLADAVDTFGTVLQEEVGATLEIEDTVSEELIAGLESAIEAVTDAELDPDDDADAVKTLLDAAEALATAAEDAEDWSDLETNEQLRAEGFYDVLGHYKDFPPEWAALKRHEREDNPEMVLLALDALGSEFMERHCLETFSRMGKRAATDDVIEELLARAQKRDESAIEALGKMRATEAIDPLVEFVDEDSNPQLQKVTFRSLGEIGASEAVGPLAQKLVMDNQHVRPIAARALGMIGDTRAIAPLAETLAGDDSQDVRSATAWALRQIGTREALEAAAEHIDAEAFAVRHEARLAADALDLAQSA